MTYNVSSGTLSLYTTTTFPTAASNVFCSPDSFMFLAVTFRSLLRFRLSYSAVRGGVCFCCLLFAVLSSSSILAVRVVCL